MIGWTRYTDRSIPIGAADPFFTELSPDLLSVAGFSSRPHFSSRPEIAIWRDFDMLAWPDQHGRRSPGDGEASRVRHQRGPTERNAFSSCEASGTFSE